ncbi:Arm DNA-binding domain-containing protein [Pseudogemmobacter blasticus]|uniref:Arm DNA-binding domain-containing protein n=1 Tax=Fuscovulum blasticum TaxID=1075 RepID=UPI0039A1B707
MPLTDAACRGAPVDPSGKPRKIPDSGGLLLFVSPSGGKLWRMAAHRQTGTKPDFEALGLAPLLDMAA